jgi:hypothetical protein
MFSISLIFVQAKIKTQMVYFYTDKIKRKNGNTMKVASGVAGKRCSKLTTTKEISAKIVVKTHCVSIMNE